MLDTGLYQHLGCAGRLNGPVDNPVSSCLSCHMQAQFQPSPKSIVPAACDASDASLNYFVDLAPDELFDTSVSGAKALDFSLQMEIGMRNFRAAHPAVEAKNLGVTDRQRIMESFERLSR
jgi:hypothetical protein